MAGLYLGVSSPILWAQLGGDPRPNPDSLRAPPFSHKNFSQFSRLRAQLLDLISMAEDRVWLKTPFLSDGDIASSLFLARFRGLDVRVVLGSSRARTFESRFAFLKANKVPVSMEAMQADTSRSSLIVDDWTFELNADLDHQSQLKQWFIKMLRPTQALLSEQEHQKAFVKLAPPPGNQRTKKTFTYDGEDDGSYNYNRAGFVKQGSREQGLPTQLPKIPTYEKGR